MIPHLEVLRNIQNPSNVERALVIEVTKCTEKIRGVDLPQAHEDKLMVRVTCQKHSQKLARIFEPKVAPVLILWWLLTCRGEIRVNNDIPEPEANPCGPAPHLSSTPCPACHVHNFECRHCPNLRVAQEPRKGQESSMCALARWPPVT